MATLHLMFGYVLLSLNSGRPARPQDKALVIELLPLAPPPPLSSAPPDPVALTSTPLPHPVAPVPELLIRRESQMLVIDREQPPVSGLAPDAPVVIHIAPPVSAPITPPDASAYSRDNRPPVYPLGARRRREQGVVILSVDVTAEGRATAVSIRQSSGFAELDEAALEAVRRWRFAPATQGGAPVPARGYVDIPFVLRRLGR